MEINKIIHGDSLEKLKELQDNSIDSIVTDPPYELGFMGKSWDNTGIANNVELWQECLRVLKPGGHLLAFSGTRTYHRMASAIEDAGFEVRDMIEWVYGSGFPKSLNIGKAVDKIAGESGRKEKFTQWMRTTGMKASEANKLLQEAKIISENGTMAGHFFAKDKDGQPAIPTAEIWSILRPHIKSEIPQWVDELVERIEREREVVGQSRNGKNSLMGGLSDTETTTIQDVTKGTSEWEGWGTALKPAHEPICMARKPLSEKTVAENCLKWGTGGINIDESRVGFIDDNDKQSVNNPVDGSVGYEHHAGAMTGGIKRMDAGSPLGRFPANLIHDNSEEVRECFPETKSGKATIGAGKGYAENASCIVSNGVITSCFADSGNASRFFKSIIYQAKASKKDRGDDNNHPTVKPIALMEYLIKMVTKEGGTVLDPFAGSGTTLVAAKQNGYNYVGIELTEEYIPIIEARLSAVKEKELSLFD